MSHERDEAYPHLAPDAAAALGKPTEERIEWLRQPQWISYPAAMRALEKMEFLLRHPPKARMPGLLLVGDTNAGKTEIIERLLDRHPPRDNADGDGVDVPVLYVRAPYGPDEEFFYESILQALRAPFGPNTKLRQKHWAVLHVIRQVHVKMLVIDEVQDILGGSSGNHHRFLKIIKGLFNALRIPLVGAGTEEAHNAIRAEPQLVSRFRPYTLPRWKMDDDYRRLLAGLEACIPLRKPSYLAASPLADKILERSEGTIGEIVMLLQAAAEAAIRSGTERITLAIIKTCDYEPPSMRRRG